MVSLFAAAVKEKLFMSFLKSLEGTTIPAEVIFSGPLNLNTPYEMPNVKFKYIHTENIKPAQCYEIARRACSGELVSWVADDCEFPNDVIGKAYKYWKMIGNEKLILSIQTKETGYNLPKAAFFNMNVHRFFGGRTNTPLMAPLGIMSRQFLNNLGGIDRRYLCGQYENDIVMRAYQAGGKVEIFGGTDCYIDIDHLGKSILVGESKDNADFLKRPFAIGYQHDRNILENSWVLDGRKISSKRLDDFEPYKDKDLLTKSQSFNLSRWV